MIGLSMLETQWGRIVGLFFVALCSLLRALRGKTLAVCSRTTTSPVCQSINLGRFQFFVVVIFVILASKRLLHPKSLHHIVFPPGSGHRQPVAETSPFLADPCDPVPIGYLVFDSFSHCLPLSFFCFADPCGEFAIVRVLAQAFAFGCPQPVM